MNVIWQEHNSIISAVPLQQCQTLNQPWCVSPAWQLGKIYISLLLVSGVRFVWRWLRLVLVITACLNLCTLNMMLEFPFNAWHHHGEVSVNHGWNRWMKTREYSYMPSPFALAWSVWAPVHVSCLQHLATRSRFVELYLLSRRPSLCFLLCGDSSAEE